MTTAANSGPAEAGYVVYAFDKCPDGVDVCSARWEKCATLAAYREALDLAAQLFGSGAYQKIEIKRRLYSRRQRRHIDVTLKVIGGKKKEASFVERLLALAHGIFGSGKTTN